MAFKKTCYHSCIFTCFETLATQVYINFHLKTNLDLLIFFKLWEVSRSAHLTYNITVWYVCKQIISTPYGVSIWLFFHLLIQ